MMTATKLPPVVWEGIVKVQRSLFTTEPTQQVRINSQDNLVFWRGDAGKDILRWFDDGELKFYAKAKLRGTVIHIIRKHKEPRSW
jgi:hypothetical protein